MRQTTTTNGATAGAGGLSPRGSLLSALRAASPERPLHLAESLRVAELQANKLLEFLGLDEPAVPAEFMLEQPRITVAFDKALEGKASGSSHWNGSTWVIALNPLEALNRQRFSLFHEYKHIVDDRFKGMLYEDEESVTALEKAERAADYFAACVLMPKRWIKRYHGRGIHDVAQLADLFEVSERAMEVRLSQLGLVEVSLRTVLTCKRPLPIVRSFPPRRKYYRALPHTDARAARRSRSLLIGTGSLARGR